MNSRNLQTPVRLRLLLITWLTLFSVLMPAPLSAADNDVEEMARESVRYIKALPTKMREAFLTEKYMLLFKEEGGSPYQDTRGYELPIMKKGVEIGKAWVPYINVEGPARFVGSDGKLYNFYDVGPFATQNAPRLHTLWDQGKRTIHFAGEKNVRPYFEKELRELELKRAEYLLKEMPPLYRQALFAELLKLFHMPDGSNAITHEETIDFCGEKLPTNRMKDGCMFVDATGVEHDFHQTAGQEASTRGYHWECIKLAWHHGLKKILVPYKKEIIAMRKHHAAKVNER